jgi:hypothetical protein
MSNFIYILAAFNFGVDETNPMLEERGEIAAGQVTVFINCGG